MQKEIHAANFKPVQSEHERVQLSIEGEWPAELRGTYIRNGPNPVYPCTPYSIFDGDGMLHAISIENEGCFYSNKWVQTKGLFEERQAHKSLYPSVLLSKPTKNTSNTSLMYFKDKLLSLWEWSFPYDINLSNLATNGEFHFGNTLQDSFTAHPRLDLKNEKYYFFSHTIEQNSKIKIGTIEPDLKLNYRTTHSFDRANSSVHDIAVTENFLVLFDLPLLTHDGRISWEPEKGGQIVLFNKNFSNTPIEFKIQSCWVFHFINAFEKNDDVYVYACRWPKYPNEVDVPQIYEWKLNLKSREVAERAVSEISAEMPTINPHFAGVQNKFCYTTKSGYLHPNLLNTFAKTDLQTGESEVFAYDKDCFCGEAFFIANPKSAAEDGGWIVNLVSDIKTQKSFLSLHSASEKNMPIKAKIHIPEFVPMGFHGLWVSK
ncbi:MAG: carotenoid oxygenase family protein [Pseudobdellovibrio sp.]